MLLPGCCLAGRCAAAVAAVRVRAHQRQATAHEERDGNGVEGVAAPDGEGTPEREQPHGDHRFLPTEVVVHAAPVHAHAHGRSGTGSGSGAAAGASCWRDGSGLAADPPFAEGAAAECRRASSAPAKLDAVCGTRRSNCTCDNGAEEGS